MHIVSRTNCILHNEYANPGTQKDTQNLRTTYYIIPKVFCQAVLLRLFPLPHSFSHLHKKYT